jgi:hypothetical protein
MMQSSAAPPVPARHGLVTWGLIAAVTLGGLASLAYTFPRLPFARWPEVLLFFVLCGAAQRIVVPLFRASSISVAFAVAVGALVYLGPAAAVWVQVGSGLMMCLVPHRKPLHKCLFNLGSLAVQTLAAGTVYVAAGGAVGPTAFGWELLPATLLATLVFVFANTGCLAAMISLTTNATLTAVWATNYRWLVPNYVGLGLIGLGIGVAVSLMGLPAIGIFLLPLGMAWYSFKLYMAKAQAARERTEELRLTNARLARANRRLSRRVTEVTTPNRPGLGLNESWDLGNLLEEVLDAALQLVPSRGAAVALIDPASGRLAVASPIGLGSSTQPRSSSSG